LGCVMDEKALGNRLQLARRRAGLTQQELCQKAGLSYSTLAKIERGAIRSPSVFTVAAIAAATQTSLEDLLDIPNGGLSAPAPVNTKKRSKNGVRFVYFDLNGVLIRFFHRAFTDVAAETGASADMVETMFWRHNDAVCRGQMSPEEFNKILGQETGIADFDWKKYYMGSVEAMPEIEELVKWTAEHYEVGILTNSMPGFVEELKGKGVIPAVNYAAIVDSSKVGSIKPEDKIYEVAQQLANVEPREILLIDDGRTNLMAADRMGWHVLWFDDYRPAESIQRARDSLAF
jgi:FMN phosphatase YigB (HAD superfamily)/DNA-binding XRE family transcriptional regulator